MPYEVFFSPAANEDIESLDPVAKKRLKKKMLFFLEDPLRYAKKLVGSKAGSYRWRVGDLRVIFDIKGGRLQIVRIGHRREVYK